VLNQWRGSGSCLRQSLGDAELDHSKLFDCSATCNVASSRWDSDDQRSWAAHGDTTGEAASVREEPPGGGEGSQSSAQKEAAREVHGGKDTLRVLPEVKGDDDLRVLLVADAAGAPEALEGNEESWLHVPVRGCDASDTALDSSSGALACLDALAPASVSAIYASHILQSYHYRLGDGVRTVLRRWHALLKPGGRLYLSVPDFATLCWLYLSPSKSINGRFRILQMMMGTQEDAQQVARSGFDIDVLGHHLYEAGFVEYERVPAHHLFADLSARKVSDTYVSLNVVAYKAPAPAA